ncbi:MAG: hypothetical protein BZ138_07445 [Methanosphaera sp. rholeuAM270]|nr:MAG: hypothetical protein BZ138_07445 [Methanosphaera sp. rholeuAM270]
MEVIKMYHDYSQVLQDYECGTDFTPLCVEVSIRPPLFTTNPWIYLDGILSYLCMRDALGEEYYSLPSHETVDISCLQLPLKKTDDVYHASVGVMNNPVLKRNTFYKRFTDKETHHLIPKQRKGRIRTNSGHFKDFMINMPMIITNKVTFYCCGDKKEITRLLGNLTHLGKKTSIGGGHIKEIHIHETEVDYSFYKDGNIMKPLPSHIDPLPVTQKTTWRNMTYKPPYWEMQNAKLCRAPKNQLTEKREVN